MKVNLRQQTEYLESRVGIDLYVYSGNGELFINQMPKLCEMEGIDHTDKQAMANADRTLALCRKRLLGGVDIFSIRGEDCSGLLANYLREIGFIKYDMTADAIYRMAMADGEEVRLEDASEGDLLFKGSDKKKTHIGTAVSDKYAVESKNHDVGVVKTVIADEGWKYCVRPRWYTDEVPVLKRELYFVKDDLMKGTDVRDCQDLLIAKGYNPGEVDGIYGKNTEIAVKNFQNDAKLGIKRLGTVGKKTAEALGFKWEGDV